MTKAPMRPDGERVIQREISIRAPREDVWAAWTTAEGARSFFAPRARIELRANGAYEILFNPDAEPGLRGSEGCHVLALQAPSMLSFTWNAPLSYPEIRRWRTSVVVRLSALPDGSTRVRLTHGGWGEGDAWDAVYDYFSAAWEIVLHRLRHYFEIGPFDWSDPPRP